MLDIVYMEMCSSIDGPLTTNEGGYYQHAMFSERHWPYCTCPANTYSKATINFGGRLVKPYCKHIRAAQEKVCGWHQQYSPEAQETKGVCPKCGRPTVGVTVRV